MDDYKPSNWEKGSAFLLSFFIIGLVSFLVIRNKPFSDPTLIVLVRIIVSLAVSVFAAVIPGFLQVSWSGKGIAVRAGGAMGVFALTFLFSPKVIQFADEQGEPYNYPFYELEIPLDSVVSDSDPSGAIEITEKEFAEFMGLRVLDQEIFYLSITIPWDLGREDELSIMSKGFKFDDMRNEVTEDPISYEAFMFGNYDQFENDFNRIDVDRFERRGIYQGFFQVFRESCFSGSCFNKVQFVRPNPDRASNTYRVIQNNHP